jgi:dihydroflavonol-4-reductase
MKGKRILVTGASGFVGGAVVARLGQTPHQVDCLVRRERTASMLRERYPHIRTRIGDLGDPTMREALEAGVGKVVHVSTAMAYGFPEKMPFRESSTPGPHMSDYARSKFDGDAPAWELHARRGLPLTVVYLAAVIGRGDPKGVMQIQRFVRGEGEAYLVGQEQLSTAQYFGLISELSGVPVPERTLGPGGHPAAVAVPDRVGPTHGQAAAPGSSPECPAPGCRKGQSWRAAGLRKLEVNLTCDPAFVSRCLFLE